METQRWIRYIVPGSLVVLLFGSWFFADERACDCYGRDVDGGGLAAVAIGAAVPFGFLASVLMNEIVWCRRVNKILIRQFNYSELYDAYSGRIDAPVRDMELLDDRRKATYIDIALARMATGEGRQVERARSLIDLVNGLSAGLAAVMLAVALTLATLTLSSIVRAEGWDGHEGDRLAILGFTLGAGVAVFVPMWFSQWRVSEIAYDYVDALFEASLPKPTKSRSR